MDTNTIKSRIIKIAWLLPMLLFVYIVAGFLSVLLIMELSQILPLSFGGFVGFSGSGMIVAAVIELLVFIVCYKFLYNKAKQPIFALRILLYSLFISFSAALLFYLFNLILPFSHFLRFRISYGFSIDSPLGLPLAAVSSFVGYTLLTMIFELKNVVNNFIKPLIYWFSTILFGWYLSIPILILYTGVGYQKDCIWSDWSKSLLALDYCYNVGEKIYNQWVMVPGIIVFIVEIAFIILYFIKFNKEKEK